MNLFGTKNGCIAWPVYMQGVLCGTAKIRAGVFTSGTGSTLENRDDIGKILRLYWLQLANGGSPDTALQIISTRNWP